MQEGGVLKSFIHALRGVKMVFKEERNFRIQIFAGISAVVLSFILSLSVIEKSILVLLALIVLILELLNSVLERLMDVFRPRVHGYIKDAKDAAAGAVLLASLGALAIGAIIFYPHLADFIFGGKGL